MPWLFALAVLALVIVASFVSWFDGEVTDGAAGELPTWMFTWAMRADELAKVALGVAIGVGLAWAALMAGVA